MSQALERLQEEVGLEIPTLVNIYSETADRLDRRHGRLSKLDLPVDAAVVFVGSWGRHEVTSLSDNDYYFVTRTNAPLDAENLADEVTDALLQEEADFSGTDIDTLRGPGREGIFGGRVDVAALTTNIGLNRDTNETLTQRMLLVLESVAIHNSELHTEARETIINNYLDHPIKSNQPPRLFLNDVVRYWRTMCVDFAGKMRDRDGEGWGLRNAKLRTTRKMLFSSGLIPLMRCAHLGTEEIPGFLQSQFALTPTDRVADAFVALEAHAPARRVFSAYESFLVQLADQDVRKQLDSIKSRAAADESELFQSVARLGEEVESGLLELLFGPDLEETTRKYGIF